MRCAWQSGSPAILAGLLLLVSFPIALHLGRVSLPDIIASLPASCVASAPLWLHDVLAGVKPRRRDLHATLLHQLGFDHERFTYRFQGLDARLTGVEPAHVVREILV